MRTLLHVGCGNNPLAPWLKGFEEVRLDVSNDFKPDIIADMRKLPDNIGPFDMIYGSHVLEHVYPHEVVPTLKGFHRVLRPDGVVIMHVPNLEGVSATEDVVFISPSGPITGLDMLYGHHDMIAYSPHHAHHCGFVKGTLRRVLEEAGFSNINVLDELVKHELIGTGTK